MGQYLHTDKQEGKRHTIQGTEINEGILPRAFEHIFTELRANITQEYLVRATYIEIYNEEITDLLSQPTISYSKLALREKKGSGIYVEGLSSTLVNSPDELRKVLQIGNKKRMIMATHMSALSTRSHLIFSVILETTQREENPVYLVRKLYSVVLAGSERMSKTQATGQRLMEARNIGLSISAIGLVISALTNPKSQHIPYRDSKLTRLLQDSLGGKTKTLMIVNVGPAEYNYDESLGSLRYANRAKFIKK